MRGGRDETGKEMGNRWKCIVGEEEKEKEGKKE